jgi:hypothetical protein
MSTVVTHVQGNLGLCQLFLCHLHL